MRLQIAAIIAGFCGAVFAIPTNAPRGEREKFPWPPPDDDSAPEPEPTLPIPGFPMDIPENTEFPQFLPGLGGDEDFTEPPLSNIPGFFENLPWDKFREEER